MKWLTGLAAGLALSAGTVHAADKWDMPTAYVDSNFHTQNGKLFAEAVGVCTGGDLEIVVHGGGTLFKGGEIKRAVQTGRAPIGERLLSAHQSENAVFGFDSVPFLASSFEASDRLWQAARGRLTKILAKQNLVLLYSIPWPPQGRRCHVNHRVTSLWAPTPEIMQRSSLAATVSSRRRGIGGVFGGRPDGVGR